MAGKPSFTKPWAKTSNPQSVFNHPNLFMPHFKLTKQHPKPKDLGAGSLSISSNGEAQFFEGNAEANAAILASMVRVRIEWAAAAGILVSGMEMTGYDKSGRAKYQHQEWLLRHLKPNTDASPQ